MEPRLVAGIVAAVVLPVLATVLTLNTSVGQFPTIPYFMAVLVASLLGRWIPGLVATVISAALLDYYFIPRGDPGFGLTAEDALALAAFAATAVLVSAVLRRRDRALEETRVARQRLELVSQASELLALSLDYPATFTKLGELVVGDFADLCLIDVRTPSGGIDRVAAVHRDPAMQPLADLLRTKYAPAPGGDHPVSRVMRTGAAESLTDLTPEFMHAATRDDEHFRITQELGFRSFMCVALEARDHILGTLTFVSCDPERRYGPEELSVAEELARRAAVRLDNARLYTVERQARAESEANRLRLAVLATAGRRLADSIDYDETMQSILDLAVQFYCEHAILYLGRGATSMELSAMAHRDPERGRRIEEILRRYVPKPEHPASQFAEAMRTGRPVAIREVSEAEMVELGLPPELVEEYGDLRARSGLILPLMGVRGPIGALSLTNSSPGLEMGADDVEFAVQFADRVARSLENASLFESQRHISQVLQRSLLPGTLPQVHGYEIAGRYVAAGEHTEVGGDFYDVLPVGPGAAVVALGDACGRGPEAAAVMGKARATLRALARRVDGPADLLREVNEILLQDDLDDRFVTACVLRFETTGERHRLRAAVAGHPRPIVVPADGPPRFVGIHGPILGVWNDVEFFECFDSLAVGDAVVTFTDGIETRDELAEDRAMAIVRSLDWSSADELADALAGAGATDGLAEDDVAVVAVRRLR